MKSYKESQLFLTIKQEVDKFDAYSLLESGCPRDEFDIESKMIYERLKKGMDSNQIAKIMSDVFIQMFEDNFSKDMFLKSAKNIAAELNK